jgi:hypothetical protein
MVRSNKGFLPNPTKSAHQITLTNESGYYILIEKEVGLK